MVLGNLGNSANQILIKIKGDDKDFQQSISKSNKSMSSFATKAKAYGPMVGAAFAAAAVGFVAMSIKWAAAEEVVTKQTSALLKAQGVMWADVGGEFDAYMKKLERLTTYNDTDLQMAFNSMIAAGMSYTEAMESMNTVTSMAFSLNGDLATMSQLVGKAYNGQTGSLSRYGIVLKGTMTLQEYVALNFADASARSETLEGQMDSLTNQMYNVGEVIGTELLPPLTAFLTVIGDWAVGGGAAKTVAAFQVVGKSVWLFIDSLQVLQATQDLLVARVGLTLGTVTKLEYNAAVKNLNNMSDAYAKTAMGINDAMAVLGSQAGKNFNSNFSNNVFDGGSARAQGEADGTSYGSGVASGIASKIPEVRRASSKMAQSAMSDPGFISTVGKYRERESYTRKSGNWDISYQSGGG